MSRYARTVLLGGALLAWSLAGCGAGNEPAGDPSRAGPFRAGLIDSSFTTPQWGSYAFTIYYPAKSDGYGAVAEVADAPHPALVFAHGQGASKGLYTWLGRHLATWGYVALLFSVPAPDEESKQPWIDGIRRSIDTLLAASRGTGALAGLVDPSRIGVAGHSQGAMAALLAAAKDCRIRAVVSLSACKDPLPPSYTVDPYQRLTIPVQLQVGSCDAACPPDQSQKHYDLVAGSRYLVVVNGGNHIGYLDGGVIYELAKLWVELGLQPDAKATISRDEQERLTKQYLTSWLHRYLMDDDRLDAYLFGEWAEEDLARARVSRLVYSK